MMEPGNAASAPNPFPLAAVARLTLDDRHHIHIATPAAQRAFDFVDEFLADKVRARIGSPSSSGRVLAIVGEYGTGKTHLALQLLRRLRGAQPEAIELMYVDAPADTFLTLYRERFLARLGRSDLKRLVFELYADVVADSLKSSDLTRDVADSLRARQTTADKVVQQFGLIESSLRDSLFRKLAAVTQAQSFATALALLLRPEFEDAAWEWLSGSPPDRVLVERGISDAINTDVKALEAMGVIALLFSHRERPFVLVIDELEKILSSSQIHRIDSSLILAFKKLLEVFHKSSALLILCGLPDFLEILPADALQRIELVVKPAALTSEDTIDYILQIKRESASSSIVPFTEDVVQYIVDLSGGNARRIMRLCYYGFEAASRAGALVTRAMVRNVAREQFEISKIEDVQSEIERTLDTNGWVFESPRVFDGPSESDSADYWVPAGQGESGVAVVVVSSILDEETAEALSLKATRIANASSEGQIAVVVVVNGYATTLALTLVSGPARVLVYEPWTFSESLQASLTGLRQRLATAEHDNVLGSVSDRVDQLIRQTARLRSDVIELVSEAISPTVIQSAIGRALRHTPSGSGNTSVAVGSVTRTELDSIFAPIELVLRRSMIPAQALVEQFDELSHQSSLFGRHLGKRSLSSDMFHSDWLMGFSAAYVLLDCADAFKRAIESQVHLQLNSNARNVKTQSETIGDLCRSWDRLVKQISDTLPYRSMIRDIERFTDSRDDSPLFPSQPMLSTTQSGEFEARLLGLGEVVYRRCRYLLGRERALE